MLRVTCIVRAGFHPKNLKAGCDWGEVALDPYPYFDGKYMYVVHLCFARSRSLDAYGCASLKKLNRGGLWSLGCESGRFLKVIVMHLTHTCSGAFQEIACTP